MASLIHGSYDKAITGCLCPLCISCLSGRTPESEHRISEDLKEKARERAALVARVRELSAKSAKKVLV